MIFNWKVLVEKAEGMAEGTEVSEMGEQQKEAEAQWQESGQYEKG